MLPFQAGINARLAQILGSPIRASFVSFLVGTIALLLVALFVFKPLPSTGRLGGAPWWVWIGGLLGAVYVVVSVVSAPKIGAATLFATLVAGQAIVSVIVDEFGWVGFEERPVSLGRIAGVVLLLGGVGLVRFF